MPWLVAILVLLAAPAQAEGCRQAIAQAEREANIPPGLLQAIGRVESGRRDPATGEVAPWPWAINAEGQGQFLPSREAALAAVRQLQAQGVRSIDVGCMQVNLRHHPRAFASLEEAFDPLANARYAARFLNELQAGGRDWMTAASHYHSQTPYLAEAYRARVAAAWPVEQARLPPPTTQRPPVANASLLSNRAERAQLLLPPSAPGRGLDAYRAAPVPLAATRFASAASAPGPR